MPSLTVQERRRRAARMSRARFADRRRARLGDRTRHRERSSKVTLEHRPGYGRIFPPSSEQREARLLQEEEARKRSENIDRMLRHDDKRNRRKKTVKVLLLGQSESGKSTTLKRECLSFSALDLCPRLLRASVRLTASTGLGYSVRAQCTRRPVCIQGRGWGTVQGSPGQSDSGCTGKKRARPGAV